MFSPVVTAILIALVLVGGLAAWAVVRYLLESERQSAKPDHGNRGGPADYVDDATVVAYQKPIDITAPAPEFVTAEDPQGNRTPGA